MLLPLSTSVTTVELWIIYLQSAPSLVMRKSARRLVSCEPSQGLLMEGEVEEAKVVVVDVGMDQVAGQILKGNVLLGTVQQKATLLE
jgi:5,10-methylene-tetrahydrofolate dehydrogenase/methenyl tetrahydrofolate cyclohydrolase